MVYIQCMKRRGYANEKRLLTEAVGIKSADLKDKFLF